MNKESKIYVAGHRGLVGSALWKRLTEKGYGNLIGKSRQELDLLDARAVADFFEKEQPEYVFLAAAKVGGILANHRYRGDFIYENLLIQSHVIHQAYRSGVKKLLFLGSTCIYPGQAPQPIQEEALLTGPLEYTNESYALAKIAGIRMCESYNLQYGTNFISVMPTNLYGPNDNFNLETSHVLPALLRKIHLATCLENGDWERIRADLNQNPVEGLDGSAGTVVLTEMLSRHGIRKEDHGSVSVEIWGSGNPLREFLWSEDMADACVYVMENTNFSDLVNFSSSRSARPEEVRNTHLNIGTGKEISIRDLAGLIKTKTGFRGSFSFNTAKPDGTLRKLTDVSRLHALGWHHRIEIEEGLRLLYETYCRGLAKGQNI